MTHDVVVTRPDGRKVVLTYNSGELNRLDRLTAANYGMSINTNLCKNRFVTREDSCLMLQAASIYTKGNGRRWQEADMVSVMMEVAKTSLQMLGRDLFVQLSGGKQGAAK
jgi:type II restriction enzyme